MRNKWLKRGILFLAVGCLTFSMTGCKEKEILNTALEKLHLKTVEEPEEEVEEKEVEPEVEVAKPELTTNLSGSVTYEIGDAAEPLTVEATTSDEGEITYQWYQSFTNTNGGGTIIEGATENTFTPPTKEAGIVYYYVVATSTIQNSTNRITSETAEVVVSEKTEAETAAENAEAPAETQEEQPEAPAETQPEQ
ncbi:hypothetical protein [Blautia sp.]|uniref:hypothetical protein n=1 Tax=Blautia sp. TaxID=1955243 RepID=UPI002E78CEED|nr:hypothetical protein [Blautia sp.]MEE0811380.1 hypothetical protein [Blautia sp.]